MGKAYLLCGENYGFLFDDLEQVCEELMRLTNGGLSEYTKEGGDSFLCLYELEYNTDLEHDPIYLLGEEKLEIEWPASGCGTPLSMTWTPDDDDEENDEPVTVRLDELDGYVRLLCER